MEAATLLSIFLKIKMSFRTSRPQSLPKNVHKLLQKKKKKTFVEQRVPEEGAVSAIDRFHRSVVCRRCFPAGAALMYSQCRVLSLIQITRGFFPGSFSTNSRYPLIRAISKSSFVWRTTTTCTSATRQVKSGNGSEILGMTFKSMLRRTLRGFFFFFLFWGWITRRTKRIILLIMCSVNREIWMEGRKEGRGSEEKKKDVRH